MSDENSKAEMFEFTSALIRRLMACSMPGGHVDIVDAMKAAKEQFKAHQKASPSPVLNITSVVRNLSTIIDALPQGWSREGFLCISYADVKDALSLAEKEVKATPGGDSQTAPGPIAFSGETP